MPNTLTRTLLATVASASLALGAPAQTATVPPPLPLLLYSYQYWPTQYIQFLENSGLPYTMVELDVDSTGKQPLYHCVLTAKDGTRTHYSTVDGIVAGYKAMGEPSYKVAMAFESDDTGKPGSTAAVRFTLQDGKPLEWRFVQGSDISAQGSGLTPLPDSPVPVFAYREEGAVAGEGTAIRIGDTTSPAEVWKEISKPPYFVGYRGAVTSGAHLLVLTKGTETWTVAKSPGSLAAGSSWELDGERGGHRTLTVEKTDGTHATVNLQDRMHPLTRTVLTATRTAAGWTVDSLRLSPVKDGDKHALTLLFTAAGTGTGTMDLVAGKKTKLASATYEGSTASSEQGAALRFTAPAWLAGKTLTERLTSSDTNVTITAH